MKLFVCFLIIFAYINNNSKASLDSFAPANVSVLLEDTTWNSGNYCRSVFVNFFIDLICPEEKY